MTRDSRKIGDTLAGEPTAADVVRQELLAALGVADPSPSLQRILFDEIDKETVSFACHQWVAAFVEVTPEGEVEQCLAETQRRVTKVLEETGSLTKFGRDERLQLECRLSNLIEQLGYYKEAVSMVEGGAAGNYVETILSKLQVSGYVYHPRKRLSVLLCLFIVSPGLMEAHFGHVLTALRSHDIALWARNPFGLLWVKILSHYVQHTYRQTDCLTTSGEAQQSVLLALDTLERICEGMGSDAGLVDRRFNHALLLRLCAQMHVREPERLLNLAIGCLVTPQSAALHTGSNQYDDADYIANLIENKTMPQGTEGSQSIGRFYTDRMELRVDGHSIRITELGVPPSEAYQLLPGHALWHGINVNLGSKLPKDLRGKNDDSLDYYKRLWRHAEEALTSGRKAPSPSQQPLRLDVGDGTEVIVCRQVGDGLFECRIVEEGYEGGGTLKVQGDVVGYYPGKVSTTTFWHQGKPLILEAYVKAVQPDGTYEFAMIQNIQEDVIALCRDHFPPDKRLRCIVNNRPGNAERAPGISEEGYSMSIGMPEGGDINELHRGTVVEVGNIEPGYNGYLKGTFIREVAPPLHPADAVHRLMLWYSQGNTLTAEEDTTDNEAAPTTEQDIIEQRHVEELLAIIDAKATLEEDYKKTFNHLAFCRLLTRLLGLDERTDYYDSRLGLLELLDQFATNGQVDGTKVGDLAQRYEHLLQCNPVLRHDMERMQIISCLDSDAPDETDRLFHWSGPQNEPLQRQLAALVLSHNYVRKAGLLPQAEEIRGRIHDLLRLSRNDTTKKHYGREDFHTEFKTSIAYPPNAMVADLPKQMHNILRVICGFLNAEGGKLYIGVNDQGYKTGISEDLKIREFHQDPSAYQVFIENKIVDKMGQEAGHHVHTHFEEDDCVLVVEVTPSPHPIMLEGHYHERMGTTTRQVNDDYLPQFMAQRRAWAESNRQETPAEAMPPSPPAAPYAQQAKRTDGPAAFASAPDGMRAGEQEGSLATIGGHIATAPRRNNALQEFDPGFEPLTALVCLMTGGLYKVIDEDDWQDYPLKLAIHEEERDGWLIIVYANGHVAKIPVDELLGRERWKAYHRWEESPAVFASIATRDDTLALCTTDAGGQQYVRFDDIAPLPTGNMQRDGAPPIDLPIGQVHRCDILPTAAIPDDLPRNALCKSRGVPAATEKGRRMTELMG